MKPKEETFWSWIFTIRLSRLVYVAIPCFILVPLLTYWLLTSSLETGSVLDRDSADIARKVLGLIDFDHLSGPELKNRIDELLRIKGSVQSELQNLEKKRQVMLRDLSELTRRIETVRGDINKETQELDKLKMSIQQTRLLQAELIERNSPEIKPPLPILPDRTHFKALDGPKSGEVCTMETCFDYSRCSLTSGMPVYLYQTNSEMGKKLRSVLLKSYILVNDPDRACVYIVLGEEKGRSDYSRLSHWQGDGRNHLIVNVQDATMLDDVGRAIIVQQSFTTSRYRNRFDVILPALPRLVHQIQPVWKTYPSMVPITRKYLLSFHGEYKTVAGGAHGARNAASSQPRLIESLASLEHSGTKDQFSIALQCKERSFEVFDLDWYLCGKEEDRLDTLEQSTFSLVVGSDNSSVLHSRSFLTRILESLQSGSIPVILGMAEPDLPLAELLDWSRFSIIIPTARIPELHFLLRTFTYADIFALKRQGRLVYETYFSSVETVFASVVGLVRTRIQIPAKPIVDTPSPSVFNSSFSPAIMESLPPDVEPEESLGPLQPPFPSYTFRRNFTSVMSGRSALWNHQLQPFQLFPHSPWEPVIPTEAKFLASAAGFRPINAGEGGSGKEFSQALGGNLPQEQFTVVMLTYEREQVLISSLSRLYGLPYLNKVIVVWNSPIPPKEDLRWPDIGVPIEVLKVEKNSLNNRFLPFSSIETEAILSVDDDSHLRHDEIIFGFRVWREHRDKLVGFPGRFHAWDAEHSSWNYNSNYSCELSMVLTGAAFYHKYYSYLYTHAMPEAIRDMVDDLMNCEDLAMNFLISHITRAPPVKVTSRWTFRCPGCPVSLSEDDSHFQERHKCINFFSRVYGYNPLLYTQYRADSVLFKTRIPADKQKCFKFI